MDLNDRILWPPLQVSINLGSFADWFSSWCRLVRRSAPARCKHDLTATTCDEVNVRPKS